jgi:uncharacterized membrane protein HdeD (DUF308 family)
LTKVKPHNSLKSPSWLRFVQIGLGAISIILSIIILTYPGIAIYTIILLFSVALLMVGFERIAMGIAPSPSRSSQLTNIGLGALVVAFGIVVMSFPIHTAEFLILLGALALLFNGIARIVQGLINKDMSRWSRGFLVGVGALSIAVSALVVIHPLTIGLTLLALSISIALLINGIQMITVGIGGKQRYAKSQVSR